MQVANILKAKGTDILSVTPDTQVIEVAKILKAKRIGALLVLEGDTIAGIISERKKEQVMKGDQGCECTLF